MLESDHPLCLLPLGPRSIVQHAVELAVRQGARIVDVVASDGAPKLRHLLGDGSRWGISLRLHLVADAEHPYSSLRFLCNPQSQAADANCLIIHTQALAPNTAALRNANAGSSRSVVMCHSGDGEWSGLARVPLSFAASLQLEQLTFDGLQAALQSFPDTVSVESEVLSLNRASDILDVQQRVLNGQFPTLLEGYRGVEPGVWIGRNVRIHPTARLVAPVFISENSEIEARATVGPGAFLGERTIIGRGALVSNSMVLTMSSVGEELTLQDSIVSRSRILNTRLGISLNIADDLLLGNLERRSVRQAIAAFLSRSAGLLMMLLTLPLVGAYWLFGGHRSRVRLTFPDVVCTPAADAEFLWRTVRLPAFVHDCESAFAVHDRRSLWRDLVVRIIPALWQVASGRVRLVGIMPRSILQTQTIPEYWKPILLSEPCGLIYESLVQSGPQSSFEEACAADLWYVMSAQRFKATRMFLRYIRALIIGPHAVRHRSGSRRKPAQAEMTISRINRNTVTVSTKLPEARYAEN